MLRNLKYAGEYRWNVVESKSPTNKRRDHIQKSVEDIIVVEGGVPAIVSKENFLAVQEKLRRSSQASGRYKA